MDLTVIRKPSYSGIKVFKACKQQNEELRRVKENYKSRNTGKAGGHLGGRAGPT